MEENEQSIDLRVLLKVFKDHFLPIAVAAVAAAVIGLILSAIIVPKQYTVESRLYVENSVDNSGSSSVNINDINAAQKLVSTCQELFKGDRVISDLRASFSEYNMNELKDMIVIEAVNSTEILRIAVTTLDPQQSVDIVTRLVDLSINEFERVIPNGSIKRLYPDEQHPLEVPKSPSFPSIPMFTAVGLIIGLVVSYVIFLVIEMVDVKVKPSDDLMQIYGIPVFAEIMDFEMSDKSSYKYSSYYSSSGREHTQSAKSGQRTNNSIPQTSKSSADKGSGNRKENA